MSFEHPSLNRGEIIDLISPLSNNSAEHDIAFANRVIDAMAPKFARGITAVVDVFKERLAAQQPATRLPEDVVIGHVTLCKGSNISLLIEYAKRLNADVERLEAQQPVTGEPVWCVATGERVNGEETYTHHDAYVPLADCFHLYTHPAPSVPDAAIDSAIYNQCPDFDDWHEGPSIDDIRAIVRAAMSNTTEPVKAAPYNPTEEMRWAMKRIDPALSSEQCRALWSAAWYAAPSTHPAPSVPDDVRHIVGWWLCNEANPQDGSPWTTEPSQRALDHMKVVSGEKHTVMRLVAIDAAMLAAKQKGGA